MMSSPTGNEWLLKRAKSNVVEVDSSSEVKLLKTHLSRKGTRNSIRKSKEKKNGFRIFFFVRLDSNLVACNYISDSALRSILNQFGKDPSPAQPTTEAEETCP